MKSIKYIIGLIVGSLFFFSCAEEIDSPNKNAVIDGIPVEITLSFKPDKSEVMTKATEAEENEVYDMYLLLFSNTGAYLESHYFVKGDGKINTAKQTIQLKTTSGTKRIYAVANVKSNNFSSLEKPENDLKSRIEAFCASSTNSLSDWLNFDATMVSEDTEWSVGRFLMTGQFVAAQDDQNDGACTFGLDNNIVNPGKIQLVRTVSHITFNILKGSNGLFTPKSWKVCNLPKSVYLYDKNMESILQSKGSGVPANNVFTPKSNNPVRNNTFNFYMLENRQPNGSGLDIDSRENPQNAPADGTYLVLEGSFVGDAENPFLGNVVKEASAEVTYYIHLGYINKNADDYSVVRNSKYIYNITVEGVQDIIVEAYEKEDPDPTYRADGDVVFADGEYIELDAHYEKRLLEFERGNKLGEFLCQVKTAKTGFNETKITEEDADIDWVYFIEDTEELEISTLNFKNPTASGLMTIKELAEKFQKGGEYNITGEETGKVYIWAFVKENYYDKLYPYEFVSYDAGAAMAKARTMTIAIKREEGGKSSVATARYVLRQKPIISIFDVGNGGGTMWGVEWINENLPNAYATSNYATKAGMGLEYGTVTRSTDKDNGWQNMYNEVITNKKISQWDHEDIIGKSGADSNNLYYAKAYAACMQRNRDENGDGVIDDEEIKWYLPAINQYQHLWVGMNAVPDEATMYPAEFRNANEWKYYHFHSSGSYRFWAEEGCAASMSVDNSNPTERRHIRCARNFGSGSMLTIAKPEYVSADEYKLTVEDRLTSVSLRKTAIGSGQLSLHNEYSDLNKVYKSINVKKKFVSKKVTRERQYIDGRWQSVTVEKWSNEDDTETYTWSEWAQILRKENPCAEVYGDGWRVPNQRELILIGSILNWKEQNQFAHTYFSHWDFTGDVNNVNGVPTGFNPQNSPRIGFLHSTAEMRLMTPKYGNANGDENSYLTRLRCVKDN